MVASVRQDAKCRRAHRLGANIDPVVTTPEPDVETATWRALIVLCCAVSGAPITPSADRRDAASKRRGTDRLATPGR
jgi:hypothetical protein